MRPLLLVAAGSPTEARRIAIAHGVPTNAVALVTRPGVIDSNPGVPLIVAPSWSEQFAAESIREALGRAITAAIGREPNNRGHRHRA